jgi:hypothetical protein
MFLAIMSFDTVLLREMREQRSVFSSLRLLLMWNVERRVDWIDAAMELFCFDVERDRAYSAE